MRQLRLLPVLMAAAIALLVLKTIGIVTEGGYVLTGVDTVLAAGGGGGAKPAAAEGATPMLALPTEPTISDTQPMLTDVAPTLAGDTPAAGPEAGGGHSTPSAAPTPAPTPAPAPDVTAAAETAADHSAPVEGELDPCAPIVLQDAAGDRLPAMVPSNCVSQVDAAPAIENADGSQTPLGSPGGVSPTEQALLERLAERRAALDKLASDLDLRTSIVEAAEKRIDERTKALAAVEAQISALVDQRKAMEDEQFKSIVVLYENMKPTDAAKIFDQLDMTVLIRLAQGMNPKKMAPILAKMDPVRAQGLTAALAQLATDPAVVASAPAAAGDLPQIVGQ